MTKKNSYQGSRGESASGELPLRFKFAEPDTNSYRIKTIGVGGAGGNAINTMLKKGIIGVDFIVTNTDRQALQISNAPIKIQIGIKLTKGLGSGGNPEIGKKAIQENYEDVREKLKNTDVLFIICGMGGGTGTGASPIIAKIAKDLDAFTVGVVTFPFIFEGSIRTNQAKEGIYELKKCSDAVIVTPNQKLFSLVNENTPLSNAFEVANQIVSQIVRGITEIIISPGLVNVDFADVQTVISEPGETFVGIGIGHGKNRALKASQQAINSPLITEKCIRNATGILINITGGNDLTLYEAKDAVSIIQEIAPNNANIIFGAYIDKNLQDEFRLTLITTGIKQDRWKLHKYPKEENLKIPTFKRKKSFLSLDIDSREYENLDIPTFIRHQNEIKS